MLHCVSADCIDVVGGWQVSEYARKSLIGNVQKELASLRKGDKDNESESRKPLSDTKIAGAIQRGFGRTDRELMEDVAAAFKLGFGAVARCGSCALLVFVNGGSVHVANGTMLLCCCGDWISPLLDADADPVFVFLQLVTFALCWARVIRTAPMAGCWPCR